MAAAVLRIGDSGAADGSAVHLRRRRLVARRRLQSDEGALVMVYWSSYADLDRWARRQPHSLWWKWLVDNEGRGVGFYHEIYQAKAAEAVLHRRRQAGRPGALLEPRADPLGQGLQPKTPAAVRRRTDALGAERATLPPNHHEGGRDGGFNRTRTLAGKPARRRRHGRGRERSIRRPAGDLGDSHGARRGHDQPRGADRRRPRRLLCDGVLQRPGRGRFDCRVARRRRGVHVRSPARGSRQWRFPSKVWCPGSTRPSSPGWLSKASRAVRFRSPARQRRDIGHRDTQIASEFGVVGRRRRRRHGEPGRDGGGGDDQLEQAG